MKRFLHLSFALMLIHVMFLMGCGATSSSTDTSVLQPSSPAATGTVVGKVINQAGAPLVGANVTVAGTRLKTDANGNLTASVPATQNTVIQAQFPGFASGFVVVAPGPGQTQVFQVALRDVRSVVGLDGTRAQTVADARVDGLNGSVSLQANSVVDGQGRVVNPVTVEIATLIPADARFGETFPGTFSGIPTGQANPGPIESYGVVDVSLKDAAGNPVNLNGNLPANLTLPIDPAHDPGTATVALWTLNKANGVWTQEGLATRDTTVVPNVYRATVTHFTPYNLDKFFSGGALRVVTVKASDNSPVEGAQVTINSFNTNTNGFWKDVKFTGPNGTADFLVPAGFLLFDAVKGNLKGVPGTHTPPGATTVTLPMN